MSSLPTRLPLKGTKGGMVPQVHSGGKEEFSVRTGFGCIRRYSIFRLLPYSANFSKPQLRVVMEYDDPGDGYELRRVETEGPGKAWTEDNPVMGRSYSIDLERIFEPTQKMEVKAYDYNLVAHLWQKDNPAQERPVTRSVKILNTGELQSAEAWFIRVVFAIFIIFLTALFGGLSAWGGSCIK